MQRTPAPVLALAALSLATAVTITASAFAAGPPAPPPPPPVGVSQVRMAPVTSSSQYIGRIQAIDRVALVPRVTAYLEKRLFDEGSEVKKGDLLYVLEQGPFQAEVLAQQGTLAQAQATVLNARVNFGRQKALLSTPAGQKQAYDNAAATAQTGAGSVLTAQGNLQSAQIQLAYTEIRAPVDGRITETSVNEGNVVSPSSGTLATIVTQDPMYVEFPAASRDVLTLQKKYGSIGGLSKATIKIQLSDGTTYDQNATLDYVAPTVSNQTDTITLRATVANPKRGETGAGVSTRELVDGEFVTVTVQDPNPVEQMIIPRASVLSDQQGDYVFTLDAQHKVVRTNLKLGQSTGADAVVLSGLKQGQDIVVDGIQKIHDGEQVVPEAPQAVVPDPGQEAPAAHAQANQAGAAQATKNQAAATQGSPSPGATPGQR